MIFDRSHFGSSHFGSSGRGSTGRVHLVDRFVGTQRLTRAMPAEWEEVSDDEQEMFDSDSEQEMSDSGSEQEFSTEILELRKLVQEFQAIEREVQIAAVVDAQTRIAASIRHSGQFIPSDLSIDVASSRITTPEHRRKIAYAQAQNNVMIAMLRGILKDHHT